MAEGTSFREKLKRTFSSKKEKKIPSSSVQEQTIRKLNARVLELEEENRDLRKRIRGSTSEEEETRIRLLARDKVGSILRQIQVRTSKISDNLRGHSAYFEDLEQKLEAQIQTNYASGCINPVPVCGEVKRNLLLQKHDPVLSAVDESGVENLAFSGGHSLRFENSEDLDLSKSGTITIADRTEESFLIEEDRHSFQLVDENDKENGVTDDSNRTFVINKNDSKNGYIPNASTPRNTEQSDKNPISSSPLENISVIGSTTRRIPAIRPHQPSTPQQSATPTRNLTYVKANASNIVTAIDNSDDSTMMDVRNLNNGPRVREYPSKEEVIDEDVFEKEVELTRTLPSEDTDDDSDIIVQLSLKPESESTSSTENAPQEVIEPRPSTSKASELPVGKGRGTKQPVKKKPVDEVVPRPASAASVPSSQTKARRGRPPKALTESPLLAMKSQSQPKATPSKPSNIKPVVTVRKPRVATPDPESVLADEAQNTRPKRKAAPTTLIEAPLNTKMRRPGSVRN